MCDIRYGAGTFMRIGRSLLIHVFAAKLILIAGAVLMLACSDEPAVIPVTEVPTTVGQKVTVTLQTFGHGRFEDPVTSSPVVRLVESSVVPSQGTETLRQVYRFEALVKGRAEIHFPHTVMRDAIVAVIVSD